MIALGITALGPVLGSVFGVFAAGLVLIAGLWVASNVEMEVYFNDLKRNVKEAGVEVDDMTLRFAMQKVVAKDVFLTIMGFLGKLVTWLPEVVVLIYHTVVGALGIAIEYIAKLIANGVKFIGNLFDNLVKWARWAGSMIGYWISVGINKILPVINPILKFFNLAEIKSQQPVKPSKPNFGVVGDGVHFKYDSLNFMDTYAGKRTVENYSDTLKWFGDWRKNIDEGVVSSKELGIMALEQDIIGNPGKYENKKDPFDARKDYMNDLEWIQTILNAGKSAGAGAGSVGGTGGAGSAKNVTQSQIKLLEDFGKRFREYYEDYVKTFKDGFEKFVKGFDDLFKSSAEQLSKLGKAVDSALKRVDERFLERIAIHGDKGEDWLYYYETAGKIIDTRREARLRQEEMQGWDYFQKEEERLKIEHANRQTEVRRQVIAQAEAMGETKSEIDAILNEHDYQNNLISKGEQSIVDQIINSNQYLKNINDAVGGNTVSAQGSVAGTASSGVGSNELYAVMKRDPAGGKAGHVAWVMGGYAYEATSSGGVKKYPASQLDNYQAYRVPAQYMKSSGAEIQARLDNAVGTRFKMGGASCSGMDCSGLGGYALGVGHSFGTRNIIGWERLGNSGSVRSDTSATRTNALEQILLDKVTLEKLTPLVDKFNEGKITLLEFTEVTAEELKLNNEKLLIETDALDLAKKVLDIKYKDIEASKEQAKAMRDRMEAEKQMRAELYYNTISEGIPAFAGGVSGIREWLISGGGGMTEKLFGKNGAPGLWSGMFGLKKGDVMQQGLYGGLYQGIMNIQSEDPVTSTFQGVLGGAAMGSQFGPAGTIIGAGLGLLSGVFGGLFGGKKKKKEPSGEPRDPISVKVINFDDMAFRLLQVTQYARMGSSTGGVTGRAMDVARYRRRSGVAVKA